ncbi:hypothetical protein BDB01DRAFT_92297 [Pilobolus umbonatus]|nr:hypothetical protein BDB01DRAFT_92297 [Pilobolus umbonatus]
MTICTGNDYIFSVIIDHDRLCFMAIHEKDETCTDDDIPETYGAACIVNKELSIIDFGFPHDIIHSEAFKEVDDVSIFYIENIVNAYYRVLRTHESKRGEKGMYIIAVFEQFIKVILQYLMADLEKDESACKKWGSIIHWVLVIPDEWNIKYIDTIKKHMINTGLRSIDTLTIIHQSYALIRHLELPHYHHSFINGEFYIVCIFKEHNKIALYGYEIGPPLKGLKNTTKHTLTEIHHLSIQYETKYFIDTIFDGNRKELEQYNINLNTLANLGHFEYWDNAEGTLYEVVSHLKNGYLSDVKESFLVEKEKELKSITLETIRDSRLLSSAGYAAIKDKIIEISKAHLSVKVIVLNDLEYVDDAITESLIDQLPPTLLAKHHNYIISEGSIFTTGAAQIIQCQLIIDNYIPQ